MHKELYLLVVFVYQRMSLHGEIYTIFHLHLSLYFLKFESDYKYKQICRISEDRNLSTSEVFDFSKLDYS